MVKGFKVYVFYYIMNRLRHKMFNDNHVIIV